MGGIISTKIIQVFVKTGIGYLFKPLAKIIFTECGVFRNICQGDIFSEMAANIKDSVMKFTVLLSGVFKRVGGS